MLIMSKKTKKQRKVYITNNLKKVVDRQTPIDIQPVEENNDNGSEETRD